jgi:Ca-activated chloride channel family protein
VRSLALLFACGQPPPAPVEIEAPRPAPGVLLEALPPEEEAAPRTRRTEPLDLGVDRSPITVSVPKLPPGGSVSFAFDDGRTGFATRIPESMPLPAAAFGEGKIFISGGFESIAFYALDAKTGAHVWSNRALADNGPTAAIYDDGRVVFNTESCTLFVADAETGKVRWSKYLGDPTLAQVAVADDRVYSSFPGSGGQQLGAFHVSDGRTLWSRWIDGELLAAPVIAGDAVFVSTIHGTMFRFDRVTGKRIWRKRIRATTAPWVHGDELFVSARRGRPERQIVVDARTGDVVREHHTSAGAARDVPSTLDDWKKVWAFEGSRPVVLDGIRYDATGGEVRATDPITGDVIWHRRYASGVGQRSVGTVALAGPQVVVAARDGKLFGLDVDTGYTVWAYDVGRTIVAEPIVAEGWVYATTEDGYVIGLEVGDRTLDGWHMFGGNPRHNGPV